MLSASVLVLLILLLFTVTGALLGVLKGAVLGLFAAPVLAVLVGAIALHVLHPRAPGGRR